LTEKFDVLAKPDYGKYVDKKINNRAFIKSRSSARSLHELPMRGKDNRINHYLGVLDKWQTFNLAVVK
jgi:hypothetical protein